MAFGAGTVKAKQSDELKQLRQSWSTPRPFFDRLHSIFAFSVDACAASDNALLPRYWSADDDCRQHDWAGEVAFVNPPFGLIASLLPKCVEATTAVVLVPITSLTTRYMGRFRPAYMAVPDARLAFVPPAGLQLANRTSPCLGTILALYGAVSAIQTEQLRSSGLAVYSLEKFSA